MAHRAPYSHHTPNAHFAATAYADVDVATGVASASPHRLTLMLYDAALKQMGLAERHMEAGRMAEKGNAMTMAIRIVEEGLKGTLDLSSGTQQELALSLKALYEYINSCLLKASLRNDPVLLAEARALLTVLRDAWAGIAPSAPSPMLASTMRQELFNLSTLTTVRVA
jgi:flagellar protein FliS